MKPTNTLLTIATNLGKDKRTVQLWYQKHKEDTGIELGEKEGQNGTRYFTDEESEILCRYGSSSNQPAKTVQVTVETGNHSTGKMIHVGSPKVNLEKFRTTRDRSRLENRTEFLNATTGYLEQIEQGMDEAEAEVEAELRDVQATNRQAKRRIETFHRRADQYRLKTDILASIQDAQIDEIDELAAEMNALGNDSGGADTGQS